MGRISAVAALVLFSGCCCAVPMDEVQRTSSVDKVEHATPARPSVMVPAVKQIGNEGGAVKIAEEYVRKHLALPNDAEFSWFPECQYRGELEGKGLWLVSGTVKALNPFGTRITHTYTVSLACTTSGATNMYEAVTISLNDKFVYANDELLDTLADAATRPSPDELEALRKESEAIEQKRAEEDWQRQWDANKRLWRDKSGMFSVEAMFHDFKPGYVVLLKEDKSIVEVELKRLAEGDRLFAIEEARRRGKR